MANDQEENVENTPDKTSHDNVHLYYGKTISKSLPGEELVISGMSGRFPESDNIYQYRDNLMNKVDMVTCDERRWKLKHSEIPQRSGKVNEIEKFDSGFFGIHYDQVHSMDPVTRILLECAVEAVLDAGYHPDELKGTRTGVFTAVCILESEKPWYYETLKSPNFASTGCARSVQAQWISHFFKTLGPSTSVDTACSSSLTAFDYACRSIKLGHCDRAIVGSGNLCMHPKTSLQFSRLGVLSSDGSCKCFDGDANGYARSEAISVVVIQKSKDARRIYANVVHTKVNCDGYKEEGITFPSGKAQYQLLSELYQECDVNPHSIDLLEAHATGTKVGDPEEIWAMDEFYCTNRDRSLYIGSVKSNHGHTEPVSGLCSIVKVLLAMENDCFLPNIGYNKSKFDPLINGKMVVVSEVMPWPKDQSGLVAINNFGFGGGNVHVLLKRNMKAKAKCDNSKCEDNLPRLICFSGSTKEALNAIATDFDRRNLDTEFVRLMHEIFSKPIKSHPYRGFSIITRTDENFHSTARCDEIEKTLCLIFGGPSKILLTYAKSFQKFTFFTRLIHRIQTMLHQHEVNVNELINEHRKNTKSNLILASALVQITLVDLLRFLELDVDYIVGYSIGEIAAGYADGSLTLEEAVAIAFHTGECLAKFDTGNLTYEVHMDKDIRTILPSDFEIVSHSSNKSYVISGPHVKAMQWAENLKNRGVVVKETTNRLDVYFKHKNEISRALLECLSKVLPNPRKRSLKWISASNRAESNVCAAYFTNAIFTANLEMVGTALPKNSVILHTDAENANLDLSIYRVINFDWGENFISDFLITLGRLYEAGFETKLEKLYPKIEWPVSAGTPMISPLIKWNHEKDWFIALYSPKPNVESGDATTTFDIKDTDWAFVTGHVIDSRNLIPATGYLYLVWEHYAVLQELNTADVNVVFENVKFHRATNASKGVAIKMFISIQKKTGNFEVAEIGQVIVSGKISTFKEEVENLTDLKVSIERSDELQYEKKDIYKELKLRGYNYSGLFCGIETCDLNVSSGLIEWTGNWVSFMDNMLQIKILQADSRNLYVPTSIEKLIINSDMHKKILDTPNFDCKIHVYVSENADIIRSGGVEIRGLKATPISKRKALGEPVLETYRFVPLNAILNLEQCIRVNAQIILEYKTNVKFTAVEVIDDATSADVLPVSPILLQVLGDQPLIKPELSILSNKSLTFDNIVVQNKNFVTEEKSYVLVVDSHVLHRTQALDDSLAVLKDNGFILSREDLDFDLVTTEARLPHITIITSYRTDKETLVLMQKKTIETDLTVLDLSKVDSFEWLSSLQSLVKENKNVLLLSQNVPVNGLLGFINCLRREPYSQKTICMFIIDRAPQFDVQNEFYAKQLKKGMPINVYKDGSWGTYRHLSIEQSTVSRHEHVFCNVLTTGDLSSLSWLEGPLKSTTVPPAEKVAINVHYAALNFRDIMTASGRMITDVITRDRLEQQIVQGFEFAGKLANGESVLGMVRSGALASIVIADSTLLAKVPQEWSLEDAATVTVTYSTALFCLETVARIKDGQSILIHAGTGGVGQSAINIALYYKCKIFTTVGTQEKRKYIREHFPEIPDSHIGNSRDTSFEQLIFKETKGRGVDLILNSLSEEKLQTSTRCLAPGGKFLEIGKYDIQNNSKLNYNVLSKGRSFHGVMLDMFFGEIPSNVAILIQLLKRGMKHGYVKPLPRTVFDKEDIEQAFRYMATGKHTGKVLIRIQEDGENGVRLYKGIPRFYCNSLNCSIIVGGLGGFGLELADWLVLRGATKLILVSRNGLKNGYQASKILNWKRYGVTTHVSSADVTTKEGCLQLITEGNKFGPIECIFNLAVVLKDANFENQSENNFEIAFAPKALATKYLDEVSRKLCPKLRKFVVFSSAACGRGNAGQTNYGMANSVMERICEQRQSDGYPALAIQWGAIGEVGIVAEMLEQQTEIEISGTLQQKISSCLSVLDTFLNQHESIVSSMVVAEKRGGATGSNSITDVIMNIIGIKDIKSAGMHTTLSHLGMDSITAVEIKQALEREFDTVVTEQDIRALTFAKLQDMEIGRSGKEQMLSSIEADNKYDSIYLFIPTISVETDEFQPIVRLKSLVIESAVAPSVIFLPGLEGTSGILEPLAANITSHVFCLRYHYNDPHTCTIETIAQQLLPFLEDYLSASYPFTIVAYSFSCIVAVQLISLLETKGRTGHLIMIDGSQTMFTQLISSHLPNFEDENVFQTFVLGTFAKSFISVDTLLSMKSHLLESKGIEERVNLILEYSQDKSEECKSHQRQVLYSSYGRVKSIMSFRPTFKKLRSSVTLFKPSEQLLSGVSHDYDIQDLCQLPVTVTTVEGNHVTILKNLDMATNINNIIKNNFVQLKNSALENTVNMPFLQNIAIKQI